MALQIMSSSSARFKVFEIYVYQSFKLFSFSMLYLDSGLTSRVLMEGSLSEKVRCEESLWSLLPSQYISISLEKVQSKWWTRVLQTDPEIDKQKIDTTQQV